MALRDGASRYGDEGQRDEGFEQGEAYATLEKARTISLPSLVIHGTADQVVPFAMGERVARSLPACTFVPMSGGRHEDLFLRGGRGLLDRIAVFLR